MPTLWTQNLTYLIYKYMSTKLVTEQALLDEVAYEESNYQAKQNVTAEEIKLHNAFKGGLERAIEMCDCAEFQPEPTYDELEAMLKHAEHIINCLMDIVEKECPETYSMDTDVTKADDWLRWLNGELTVNEIKEYFEYPEPLRDTNEPF